MWSGIEGKQVLITGATSGIGLAAAEALAKRGAKLALVARSQSRARAAVARIRAAAGGAAAIDVLSADLASLASVRALAAEVQERYPRLDALLNNAGAMYGTRRLNPDGIELTWAVNHLAPFVLTTLLLDRLKESAPARVVTTASAAHMGASIPFDDLNAERSYRSFGRYGETKLANILFTRELARRLQGSGVTASTFHPGLVATGFNRNNSLLNSLLMVAISPMSRNPQKGAETLVWLADAPQITPESGGYFVDKQLRSPSAAAQDMAAAQLLWETSEAQVLKSGA